jgi:NitT/TauT family transport system substrate-binding protein
VLHNFKRHGKGRRQRWTASGIAVVVAATGLIASTSSASPKAAKPLITVTVVDSNNSNYLQIPISQGIFKKFGLNVQLSSLDSGVDVLAALQGGSADIGYADLFAGINAIANGFNVDIVADNNVNETTFPVLVATSSGINSVADLSGKTVGVAPVPQITVNLDGFLKANGLNPASVNLSVLSSPAEEPQELQSGSINALAGSWLLEYQNDGEQAGGFNFKVLGNPNTAAWSNPKATTAAFWSTSAWAKTHKQVEDDFDNALHYYREWWYSLPVAKQASVVLEDENVNYEQISGGNAAALKNLLPTYYQTGPINLAATESWYKLGLQYAPTKIVAGVDWQAHVFSSARLPAPKGPKP